MKDIFSPEIYLMESHLSRFQFRYEFIAAFFATFVLSGCSNYSGFLTAPPTKLFNDEATFSGDQNILDLASLPKTYLTGNTSDELKAGRNNFISMRMYAIDLEYTKYESTLTTRTGDISLAGSLVNLGLTGAASVTPVAQTGKILSAIATGTTGATAAVDKDILLSQAIQTLETQMRTDRNIQAAKIIASMKCNVANYPLGLALTDLEDYYRAGTMASAQVGISRTTGDAEGQSKATKDAASPSNKIAQQGEATLLAVSQATAATADPKSTRCG